MHEGLYWLTSYPKSGNTWTRAFIANLTSKKQEESVDINDISIGCIASAREWLDSVTGYNSNELSHEEVDRLRPLVYRWSAEQQNLCKYGHGYHKVHDAWTRLPDGSPLFPVDITRAALYIVRNPLDVAISFAYHSERTLDDIIKQMACSDMSYCCGNQKAYNQLRQKLLTWSEHVQSWIEAPNLNLRVVRYEDMLFHSKRSFAAIAEFLQIHDGDINKAIEACNIENLQQQESKTRFEEAPQGAVRFFRKGKAGDWQQRLRPEQIQRIIQQHGSMMRRLGYLDDKNIPQVEPKAAEKDIPMLLR